MKTDEATVREPELENPMDPEDLTDEELATPPRPLADRVAASRQCIRLRKIDRRARKIEEDARTNIEQINAWKAQELAKLESPRSWIRLQLESFMRHFYAEEGDKTLSLPDGELKLKKDAGRLIVHDDELFIEWAEANGHADLITTKITKSVDKLALKKLARGEKDRGTADVDSYPVLIDDAFIPGVNFETRSELDFDVKVGD